MSTLLYYKNILIFTRCAIEDDDIYNQVYKKPRRWCGFL